MRQTSRTLSVQTPGRRLVEITAPIEDWLAEQHAGAGLLTVFCRHTSASLLIQENADPDVRADLQDFFERIAPEDPALYRHDDEGPDDMPSHIRAALTQVQLSIPVIGGRMALGRWQGVYLMEHRRRPHRREVVLHLLCD